MTRIFYCDKCGERRTDDEMIAVSRDVGVMHLMARCEECWRWLMRIPHFKAKRGSES
jgi:uncharacterized Zn finger protein